METPSSRRTVSTSLRSKKQNEDSLTKSRPVLLDITNDSPIVGLAKDRPTPASAVKSCRKSVAGNTPGSGESLLRSQVNSLLQRVEEGEKISSAATGLLRFHPPLATAGGLLGFVSSPSQMLAPTPANTPQVPNLSGEVESNLLIPKQQIELTLQVEEESQINRMLTFDSPGKSEELSSASSAVTYEGTEKSASAAADDDSSSVWSIQANASSAHEDDEHGEDDIESHDFEQTEDEVEEPSEEEGCGGVDDLCDFLGKMTVNDDVKKKLAGRHTRFVYNSDGEMEGEVEVTNGAVSPGVVALKGLPVPEGKHLRFPDEEDEDV